MAVVQPPEPDNQYAADRALRSYLARTLPAAARAEIEPGLEAMGALAGRALPRMQPAGRAREPRLLQWDESGNCADRSEIAPRWREAQRIAAERGLVATAYERRHGAYSRVHQFALAYLFAPSSGLYYCPLAASDGAAKVLLASGNRALIARALPHLASRDPRKIWTSGQWMTEAAGGPAPGPAGIVARREGERWRLYGRAWLSPAIATQMALVLARPEGNPPGASGLALFYVEARDAQGRPNGILIHRLEGGVGARELPAAELRLDGTAAELVAGTTGGVERIAPMLQIVRAWSAVTACALARRGLALARDHACGRAALRAPRVGQPLRLDALAGLEAELAGALHLAFFVAELIGREEAQRAGVQQQELLRVLAPLAAHLTAGQALRILSETIEALGGAGRLADTGLPELLREAQALPLGQDTSGGLARETLRALEASGGLAALEREIGILLREVREPDLVRISALVEAAVDRAEAWLAGAKEGGLEAGARRCALTLGRAMELALLARHAQWSLAEERDSLAAAAARRLAAGGLSVLAEVE